MSGSRAAKYSDGMRCLRRIVRGYSARDPSRPVRVGLDHARIHGEPFTTDQSFDHAALNHALEQVPKSATLSEATMPVLGEARVIRHLVFQAEPAEPTVGEIQMHLLAQPPLRSDAEAIA